MRPLYGVSAPHGQFLFIFIAETSIDMNLLVRRCESPPTVGIFTESGTMVVSILRVCGQLQFKIYIVCRHLLMTMFPINKAGISVA